MIKFFKENTIFVTNSVLLVGLFMGISTMRKIPITNQTNTNPTTSATIADTTGSQVAPSTIFQPVNTPTTSKTIFKPAPSPVVNTPIRQRFRNGDDD